MVVAMAQTNASYDYDLIVIGAGSGKRAGRIAAEHGARVAVIEGDRPGGTVLFAVVCRKTADVRRRFRN